MSLIHDFLELFFPRTCAGCDQALMVNEKFICTECLYQLPRTGYWKEDDNPVARLFWGRIFIQNAASYLHFYKGSRLQQIIHQFKYRGQKEIGIELGKLFGLELRQTPYALANAIIPVPLHPSKFKKRGYNQSEFLAVGISQILHIPVVSNGIVRVIAKETQTRKSRFERWKNVENIFRLTDATLFENKTIVLVDDVITTGSTLEACASTLSEVPGIKIMVLSLANAVI
jgi:ComF family protein